MASLSLNIPFQAGSNSLLIAGVNSGYVVEIDKIALQTQSTNPPPPPPPVNTVLLTSFGQVGSGGNDTSVFQNAINSVAQNGKVLQVPAGVYNVGPLTFPNNSKLLLDAQATVQATTGFSSGQRLLNVVNVSNVSITGTPGKSIFKMQKSEYTSGEYRHCLDIEGATNVTASGISCMILAAMASTLVEVAADTVIRSR